MAELLNQLELVQKACTVASGKSARMSILHWAACTALIDAKRPMSLAEVCWLCGPDCNCDWMRFALHELVNDGLVTKVRRPPTVNNPKGTGYRYLASVPLKMAFRFLSADYHLVNADPI